MLSTYCLCPETFSSAAVAAGPPTHLREARVTPWSESFDRPCWRLTVTSGCVTADLCRNLTLLSVKEQNTCQMFPSQSQKHRHSFGRAACFLFAFIVFTLLFAADFACTLLLTPIATDGNWMHRTRRASCLVRRSLSSSLMRDGRISAAPSGLWSLSSHSQISAVGRGDERLLVESRRRKVETDLLRTDASGRDGRETRRGQN